MGPRSRSCPQPSTNARARAPLLRPARAARPRHRPGSAARSSSTRNGAPPAIRHVAASGRSTRPGPVVISSPAVIRSTVRRADPPGLDLVREQDARTRAPAIDDPSTSTTPPASQGSPTTWRIPPASIAFPWSVPSPSGCSVSSPAGVESSRWLNRAVRARSRAAASAAGRRSRRSPRASGGRGGPPRRTTRPGRRSASAPSPARRTKPAADRVAQDATPSAASVASQRSAAERSSPGQPGRHPARHADVAVAVLEVDRAALADPGQQLAGRIRDGDVDVLPQRREQRRDLGAQRVEPEPRRRRHEHRARDGRRRLRAIGARVQQVRLVERRQARLVAGAELVEDGLDRRPVLGRVAVRGVDHLDQHVGAGHLLERGAERVDELVRQLVDEARRCR